MSIIGIFGLPGKIQGNMPSNNGKIVKMTLYLMISSQNL